MSQPISGVLTTTQQFASAAGVAVLGAVFFSGLGTRPSRADLAATTEAVTFLALALVVIAAALTLLLPGPPRLPDPTPNRRRPSPTPPDLQTTMRRLPVRTRRTIASVKSGGCPRVRLAS